MAGRIRAEDIAALRESVDVVALVGSYTSLRPAGAGRFKGICPFHTERTPSFTLDAERRLYHCFGCDAGGDVYGFVQAVEALSFPEAVEWVARFAGVQLTYEQLSPGQRQALGRRTHLADVLRRGVRLPRRRAHGAAGRSRARVPARAGPGRRGRPPLRHRVGARRVGRAVAPPPREGVPDERDRGGGPRHPGAPRSAGPAPRSGAVPDHRPDRTRRARLRRTGAARRGAADLAGRGCPSEVHEHPGDRGLQEVAGAVRARVGPRGDAARGDRDRRRGLPRRHRSASRRRSARGRDLRHRADGGALPAARALRAEGRARPRRGRGGLGGRRPRAGGSPRTRVFARSPSCRSRPGRDPADLAAGGEQAVARALRGVVSATEFQIAQVLRSSDTTSTEGQIAAYPRHVPAVAGPDGPGAALPLHPRRRRAGGAVERRPDRVRARRAAAVAPGNAAGAAASDADHTGRRQRRRPARPPTGSSSASSCRRRCSTRTCCPMRGRRCAPRTSAPPLRRSSCARSAPRPPGAPPPSTRCWSGCRATTCGGACGAWRSRRPVLPPEQSAVAGAIRDLLAAAVNREGEQVRAELEVLNQTTDPERVGALHRRRIELEHRRRALQAS